MFENRIRHYPEHQQKIIEEALRLLKETPSLASSYIRLFNLAQTVLDTSLQRPNITTHGQIKWFKPGMDEALRRKEDSPAPDTTTVPARRTELIEVLKGINGNLEMIAESLKALAERRKPSVQLQKIVTAAQSTHPTINTRERPKLNVLVIGLLENQQRHLRERAERFANLKFVDVNKNRGGTLPSADYIMLTDHVSHSVVEKYANGIKQSKVIKVSTSPQSIADKIKHLWRDQR